MIPERIIFVSRGITVLRNFVCNISSTHNIIRTSMPLSLQVSHTFLISLTHATCNIHHFFESDHPLQWQQVSQQNKITQYYKYGLILFCLSQCCIEHILNNIKVFPLRRLLALKSLTCTRLQTKCDDTWCMGGEVKRKLANGVGSQYPSHYLRTWCIQHYYRWCARLSVVDWTDTPADLNGFSRFAERQNLVSARMPSHFNWPVPKLHSC